MSMDLWIGADSTIDLGPTFEAYAAFAEVARVAGKDNAALAELYAVPGFVETQEEVAANYLAAVRAQASVVLKKHGKLLGDHARWILGRLVTAS